MNGWSAHILWLIVLCIRPTYAQPMPSAIPERLDGLAHNAVVSLVQDEAGFLWIGTADGLHRYDGYTFTVYRHRPGDATSLSNNLIKALREDIHGYLWVGTDRGLDRFDPTTEQFTRFQLAPDTLSLHQRGVLALFTDDAANLWVATNASGLYRRPADRDTFFVYQHDPADLHTLADNGPWSMYQDADGVFWVSTRNALHRYNAEADHFDRFAWPAPHAASPPNVLHANGSQLWLSNADNTFAFDRRAERFVPLPTSLPATHVLHAPAPQGLWMGTTEGLFWLDAATDSLVRVPTDPSPGAYLQNYVRTLYEDRAGTLWVGTLSGLYRINPHTKPFHHLGKDPASPYALRTGTVMAVHEDQHGVLWVGTLGGGLTRLDRSAGTQTTYQHQPDEANSLCHDLVWSLHEDLDGRLWIGTDGGLCVFSPETERFTRLVLPLEAPATAQPAINEVVQEATGRLWIGTYVGLYEIDPATGHVTHHPLPAALPYPAFQSVQSLYLDADGSLWLGLFGGYFYRLQPETGHLTRFPITLSPGQELVGEGVWAIHQDTQGIFWLGSDQGLTRLDPTTGSVRHFTQQDGLPASIVYAIAEDAHRQLWASTNDGLVHFDDAPAPNFRHYNAGDGLVNIEFNRRAFFQNAAGTMYFGGLEGVTYFDPAQIHDNPFVPPVVLTRIETANRDTTRTHPAHLPLALSYRDYALTFEFAALNFTNPSQNRYAYRLDGFDAKWVDAATRRLAHYTNLPPGSYTFRVRASNDDGVWNEAGLALPVTISPPFWKTWWFRLLVIAAVVALLTAAYRYRVAHLIAIERMRLRIASDLHDDIGSNLSSIALLSDMVRDRSALPAREQHHLAKISDSARRMVASLRDIVWSIDPDADTSTALTQRMHDTAAALLGSLRYTFDAPASGLPPSLDMNLRRHLFLCYKEILHNITRHAHATHVAIRLDHEKHQLSLTISDDGCGFDPATVANGHGLTHLHERIAEISGTLTIQSTPGSGTTVTVMVPTAKKAVPAAPSTS